MLLGVGHVLPALHFAFVAHRVCAEHGELLHSGDLPSSDLPTGRLYSEDGAEPSSEDNVAQDGIDPGGGAGHEHEHCDTPALPGSTVAVLAGRDVAHLLPAAWASRLSAQARAAHVDVALLLYAPKLAPPRG
jgi:hypothetical protein